MNMNTREKPAHTPMDQFPSAGRELLVGGIPLERLVDRVGQTPFYAYDRALLTRRVAELRAALPASIKLHYAMKANPMPAVVSHLARLAAGIAGACGRDAAHVSTDDRVRSHTTGVTLDTVCPAAS